MVVVLPEEVELVKEVVALEVRWREGAVVSQACNHLDESLEEALGDHTARSLAMC